jgi:outer membrane protein assembly factor BamB
MTLIELDVSQPWRPPEMARPIRPSRRWLAVAAVAILALGLLVTAQRPVSLAPRLVVEGTGVQLALASAADIFVLHQPNQGVAQLEAYRLADGSLLWSKAFGVRTSMVFAGDRGVVLTGARGELSVVGLDPATGAVRWQRAGYNAGQSTDRVVVVEKSEEPQPTPLVGADDDPGRQLVGLDPGTGTELWSFTTQPDADHAYLSESDAGDANALVELTRQGALRLYDLDTGAVRSAVQLDEGAQIAGFDLVGRLLLAVRGRGRLSAYNLDDGRLVWEHPAIHDGLLRNCGAILCLARDASLAGLDWSTGQQLWQLNGYVAYQRLDPAHLLATTTHEYDRNAALVDAMTGRVIGHLPDWIILAPTPDAHVVVWRPSPGGGALIGILDRDTRHITVFGHTNDWFVGPQCQISGTFLACRSATRLSVWPIPSR